MARKSRKNWIVQEVQRAPSNTKEEGLLTAAYGRLSIENAGYETDESLQNQMAMIYQFINDHDDLELVDSYMDNGFTGTNFERPEFQRLMEDVRTGKIQCIVVKDLSRFGRDYLETGYYLETIFPRLNIRFIAINDQYDSFRKEDRDIISVPVKNIVNEMYAKDLSKKICSSMVLRRQDKQAMPSGSPPYGYRISEDKSKYLIDPEAAAHVQLIFQWVRMGVPVKAVADRLTFLGILTPREYERKQKGKPYNLKPWKDGSVHKIINNPCYLGDLILGKLRQSLYQSIPKHSTPREDWVIRKDAHQPLVSREDYEAIHNTLGKETVYSARFNSNNTRAREKYKDPMKGLVYCRECERQMNYLLLKNEFIYDYSDYHKDNIPDRKPSDSRIACYNCPPLKGKAPCGGHKIYADYLKTVVMEQVNYQIRILLDINKLLDELKKKYGGKDPSLSSQRKLSYIQGRILAEEEKIATLYENLAKGIIDTEDFLELKSGYQMEKDTLLKQEAELLDELRNNQRVMEEFSKISDDIRSLDKDNAFNENLIPKMVDRINVSSQGDIEIIFVFQNVIERIIRMISGEVEA